MKKKMRIKKIMCVYCEEKECALCDVLKKVQGALSVTEKPFLTIWKT